MPASEDRTAALAEALWEDDDHSLGDVDAYRAEAARLVELLPSSFFGNPAERDELARQQAAEIARLRRIEVAMPDLLTLAEAYAPWSPMDAIEKARAALEDAP